MSWESGFRLNNAENLQRKQLINNRHVHEHEASEIQQMMSFKCVQMLQKPAQLQISENC